jgi:hypothetical protein
MSRVPWNSGHPPAHPYRGTHLSEMTRARPGHGQQRNPGDVRGHAVEQVAGVASARSRRRGGKAQRATRGV